MIRKFRNFNNKYNIWNQNWKSKTTITKWRVSYSRLEKRWLTCKRDKYKEFSLLWTNSIDFKIISTYFCYNYFLWILSPNSTSSSFPNSIGTTTALYLVDFGCWFQLWLFWLRSWIPHSTYSCSWWSISWQSSLQQQLSTGCPIMCILSSNGALSNNVMSLEVMIS